MGWTKLEVPNIVSLGDEEGQVRVAGGILIKFLHGEYKGKPKVDYQFVAKSGEIKTLGGSATLSRQFTEEHIGKFFKAEFEGWGHSANGKFKQITVNVWDGEPNEDMKKWPLFEKYYGQRDATKAAVQKTLDESPFGEKHDDDDLPF